MLVNLDTDPGEAQLTTQVCSTGPDSSSGIIDPRCHTQDFVDSMVANLTQLYNESVADKSLWGPSEINRGGSAERFPCCSPGCTPLPYCCKCERGKHGPPAPTVEQHAVGSPEPSQFLQV